MNQLVGFPGIGIEEFTINRVAFTIAGQPIYWYGILIALAFLLAIIYILARVRTFGLDGDRVLDVIIGAVIGGVIGARLYYVIFSWEIYADNPISVFYVRDGGLAIYGGVIAGFLVGYLMCRLRRVRFLPLADLAVGGLILGQAIGRWGNFVNVEAFGSNTTAPWGMVSPSITAYLTRFAAENADWLAQKGIVIDPNMPVHPTFFYESMWCLLGFLLLVFYAKHRRFDGEMLLLYFAWYGLGRSFIEGLRTDSLMWGNFRVSQVLAILMTACSVVLLIWIRARIKKKNDPEYLKLYVNTEEGQSVLAGTFYPSKKKSGKANETQKNAENIDSSEIIEPKTEGTVSDTQEDEKSDAESR